MDDEGVGRAIYPGTAPPPPLQPAFSAKEERLSGALAIELSQLKVPGLRIISSQGERMLYSRDQSEIPRFLKAFMFNSLPDLVVQPSTVEGVSAAIRFAAAKKLPVIVRGSGSSPFGGSVPVAGGIVIDMSALDKVLEVDEGRSVAVVQAGARWADLDNELQRKGLCLFSSPSSKFSTVGGWIATGGMGLNSFSSGHVSRCIQSVEIVESSGNARKISRSDKDFETVFGSEGQLGIITQVELTARQIPKKGRPHLLFFDDARSAISFAQALASSDVKPAHIVYESRSKFGLINRMLGKDHFPGKEAILVSIESESSENAFKELVRGSALSEEKEYLARYMWNERYFPMKLRKFGPGMLGSEVVVPLGILPEAIERANTICIKLGLEPLFEVHFLNDGRGLLLIYYVTDQGNTAGYTLDAVKSMMLTSMLIQLGAKPYSIGVWNNAFSDHEEVTKVRRLLDAKRRMDPAGVMNSGKYFTLGGKFGGLGGLLFSPRLMEPALKTMLLFSPITSSLLRSLHSFTGHSLAPKNRTDLIRVADECAMCGACVPVCPAYLVVGDERVTGRGKLLTAKALARGAQISKEHSDRIFLCMRCKACEQVCQSKLELVAAYDVLEKELEAIHGKDPKEIESFIRFAESTPAYDGLIAKGLVLGAPKNETGGERQDV